MTLITKTKTATIALATAAMISGMAATPATAGFDICKKVNISFTNMTGAPIQIFDLDYWDFGSNRKRSENFSNRVLAHGATHRVRRNLEGVNNAKTFIRVQFRKLKSNGKWNRSQWWNADSKTATCRRGKSFSIRFR